MGMGATDIEFYMTIPDKVKEKNLLDSLEEVFAKECGKTNVERVNNSINVKGIRNYLGSGMTSTEGVVSIVEKNDVKKVKIIIETSISGQGWLILASGLLFMFFPTVVGFVIHLTNPSRIEERLEKLVRRAFEG